MTNLEIVVGGRLSVEIAPVAEVKLLELLGVGGFGSAWKVADTATNKLHVLKIIQNIEPGSRLAERVRLEAGVSISSEYVVTVFGMRQWNPTTYLLLFEYCPGKSLDKILARQSTKVPGVIRIGRDTHQCDVVIKDPANRISRLHAEIFFNSHLKTFNLRNLTWNQAQPNLVLVDGKLVEEEVSLQLGSVIHLREIPVTVAKIEV
ncbi:hypothetical protein NUACC21_25450 [Scytonema sp. NUACC21]